MAVTSELRLKAVDQVSGVIRRIQRVFPGLDAKIDRSRKRLKMLNDKFGDISRGVKNFGNSVKGVGRTLTGALTLPAAAISGLSINEFRKYEKGLIGVSKTTDLAGKPLQDFGRVITDMSKKMPISAQALLGLAEAAGQMGVPTKDLATFAETLAKLQVTTDIEGEDGARAIARILKLTGEGTGHIKEFGNSIVALGNSVAATESEILAVANRVAGGISKFKVGSKDILALSATLRALGKESEVSGSVVQRSFLGIEQALKNGGTPLKALQTITKMTSKELRVMMRDSPFELFERFAKGLGKVEVGERGNLLKVMKTFNLEGVRVVDVLGTLVTKLDFLKKNLQISKEKNALDNEFDKFLQSLDSKIKITRNKLVSVGIEAGKQMRPFLDKILELSGKAFGFLEKRPEALKFLLVFGALAAIFAPIVLGIGSIISILPFLAKGLTMLGVGLGGGLLLFLGIPAVLAAITYVVKRWADAGGDMSETAKLIGKDLNDYIFGPILSSMDYYAGIFEKWYEDLGRAIKPYLPQATQDFLNKAQPTTAAQNASMYGGSLSGDRAYLKTPERSPQNPGTTPKVDAEISIKVEAPAGTKAVVTDHKGFFRVEQRRGIQGRAY